MKVKADSIVKENKNRYIYMSLPSLKVAEVLYKKTSPRGREVLFHSFPPPCFEDAGAKSEAPSVLFRHSAFGSRARHLMQPSYVSF